MAGSLSKCVIILAAVSLFLSATPALAQRAQRPARVEVSDEQVDQAIKRAIDSLWSQWNERTCWDQARPGRPEDYEHGINYGGRTALCAYALLASGVSYQEPRMATTLDWLSRLRMEGTYALSLRANVWAMLPREKYFNNLKQDVLQLVNSINAGGLRQQLVDHPGIGGYAYHATGTPGNVGFDNSNSQMAVLGVWAGARNGVEVPTDYWRLVDRHWRATHCLDGGWKYRWDAAGRNDQGYGSMSAAGLATMFIVFDALYGGEFVDCNRQSYPPEIRRTQEVIQKGLDWMDKNFSATDNPNHGGQYYEYYLYGVERVGLASGYKFFGTHDWYKEATNALLARSGGRRGLGNTVETSFALLFLARGRNPVLFNQLQYEGDWQNRPRALAELTGWISKTFERPVNWQIVHLNTDVADWHDAPILYISGSTAPKFAEGDLKKLRQFVLQGGTILSIAECGGAAFTQAMRAYYAEMFPEHALEPVPAEHPIFNVQLDVRRRYAMSAVSNGARFWAIHVQNDMPRSWQLHQVATAKADFEQAANIYFYVTDRGSLRNRGVSMWPAEADRSTQRTVKVARLKYAGTYDPEPLAWTRFGILMRNEAATKVEPSEPMAIGDLRADPWPMAHLTGTAAFDLSAEEKEALKAYCQAGGLLVVDAAGGNAEFNRSARTLLEELFGSRSLRRLAAGSDLYKLPGNVIETVSYRAAARVRLGNTREPQLRAVTEGDRIVCLYSAEDLTAGMVGYQQFGLDGYDVAPKPADDSAFQIMRNIVLYAAGLRP